MSMSALSLSRKSVRSLSVSRSLSLRLVSDSGCGILVGSLLYLFSSNDGSMSMGERFGIVAYSII